MADVGCPISSLPGTLLRLSVGDMCDNHPDLPAVKRIQGETDSFGYEAFDLCQICYDLYKKEMEGLDTSGICDWCKEQSPALFNKRDWEEGRSGPVYRVCHNCIREYNKRLREDFGDDNE